MSVYSAKILRYAFPVISSIITSLLLVVSPPTTTIIRGCAPPATMCETLVAACTLGGVPAKNCNSFGDACYFDKCGACERSLAVCEATNVGDCGPLRDFCEASLIGCGCNDDMECVAVGKLESEQALALCLMYPSPMGDDCADPDAGQCLAMMSWSDCDIDSCDYVACVEALEDQGDLCSASMPTVCDAVAKCDAGA